MKALCVLALALALMVPAAAAVSAAPAGVDRELARAIMTGILRDDPTMRREVCALFDKDPAAAYRTLWRTRISGIRQVYVRRGTRDAVDWVCS